MPQLLQEGDATRVLCDACGFQLANDYEREVVEGPHGDYTVRKWYYHCTNMNCPQQNKRVPLQKV